MGTASVPPSSTSADASLPSPEEAYRRDQALKQRLLALQERNERWKWYALLSACALTLFIVASVLLAWRFEARDQRIASEEAQWRETLKTVSGYQANGVAAGILLKPFLKSSRFREDAMGISETLLTRMANYNEFEALFDAAYDNPSVRNLNSLIAIDRKLYGEFQRAENLVSRRRPVMLLSSDSQREPTADATIADRIGETIKEFTLVGNSIGEVLRTPASERNPALDLTHTIFYRSDLARADLSGAILSGATFQASDVSGARFTNVSRFDGVVWLGTNWWRAREISPQLLNFLKENFPLRQGDDYGSDLTTREEYISNLRRLCEAASLSCPEPKTGPEESPKNKKNAGQHAH